MLWLDDMIWDYIMGGMCDCVDGMVELICVGVWEVVIYCMVGFFIMCIFVVIKCFVWLIYVEKYFFLLVILVW